MFDILPLDGAAAVAGAIGRFGLAPVGDLVVIRLDRRLFLGGKFGSAQDLTSLKPPDSGSPIFSGFGC